MNATVIISVYKNVEALRVVLDSLRVQSEKSFSIIISEDGESEEMRSFVLSYDWFTSYKHLTQSDDGWRKNRALNRAIVAADAPWLIFIDGDCFVHSRFVEMHLHYSASNRVLVGKRVKLSVKLSDRVLKGELDADALSRRAWFYMINKKGVRYADEGVFIPTFITLQLRSAKKLTGCNMSFSRAAIERINGFDEDYLLPAIGEDIDLVWRFKGVGMELFSVRNRAIQFHLHHKENWCDQSVNAAIMKTKVEREEYVCSSGIEKS